jgi:hypothetical protein
MVRHRPDHQIVVKVVEEPFDVKIDHPVGSPATLTARRHRVQHSAYEAAGRHRAQG